MTSDDLINQRLGQYEIKSLLGRGGMAAVYLARQASMDRDVAIKVMAKELSDDEQFVARFEHEAQLIASLQHPHILPVIDFGHEGKNIYIVMQLVRGGSLDDRLRKGALTLNTASRMLSQIASALTFAHEKGIVHRDLKPNNVLLDERNNTYLTDFGIAKMLAGTSKLTATGNILGTPAYMAPEQWRGEPVDARTDIYSLGVMTYEMVLGRLPFSGETPYTLMYKHFNDAPPPPRTINPSLNPAVENVILRALAKNADERYQSAEEMAENFDNAVRGLTPVPRAPEAIANDRTIVGDEDLVAPSAGGEMPTILPTGIDARRTPPPQTPMPIPAAGPAAPSLPTAASEGTGGKRALNPIWIGGAVLIVLALIVGGVLMFSGGDDHKNSTKAAVVPTETYTPEPSATNTPEPTATNTAEPTASPTPRITTATILSERANVRSGPGTDFDVIGSLSRGEEALVNGIDTSGQWFQIVYQDTLGWISAETVQISGNTNVPVRATATPLPTETPTLTPTPTLTFTPEPTNTPTLTPTQQPSDTPPPASPTSAATAAAIIPDLFVPTEFEPVSLEPLGMVMDYPTNWAPITGYGVIKSLAALPFADTNHSNYPTMIIGRGTPNELKDANLLEEVNDPVIATQNPYGNDLSGDYESLTGYTYPIHLNDLAGYDTHFWTYLIEVSSSDWAYFIVLAPIGEYDEAFGTTALRHMIDSLVIDGQPIKEAAQPENPPITGNSPVQRGAVVLDRFDDNQNDWLYGELADGSLTLNVTGQDYIGWTYPNAVTDPGAAYYFQVMAHPATVPNSYEYGITYRFAASSSSNQFYYYTVNQRREVSLYVATTDSFTQLFGPIVTNLVHTGPDATNTFGVLVFGDYMELYLNNELLGSVVNSQITSGGVRLVGYTGKNADGPLTVIFDDFALLPLNVTSDATLTSTASAVIGTVSAGSVDIGTTADASATSLYTLRQNDKAVVFGRSQDSSAVYVYASGALGWIDSSAVSLMRGTTPVDLASLSILDAAVQGLEVHLWPVIWPEQAAAGDPKTTMAYGQTINGSIEAATTSGDAYRFRGSAGDIVTISVTGEAGTDFDPNVTLRDSDGTALMFDDDSGPGLNSLIENYELAADGIYSIEVGTVSGAGNFTVTLEMTN